MPEEASAARDRMSVKWKLLSALAVFSVYFYVLMEWLFFATKPSFMSALDIPGSLLILSVAPLPIGLIGFAAVLVCRAESLLIGDPNYQTAWMGIARLVPVFILSSSALLLTDNFTNTVLGSGSGPQEERRACFTPFCFSSSLLLFIALSGNSRRMPGMSEG